MQQYTEIDYNTWERKEIFERFSPQRYYVTAKINITEFIKRIKNKFKFYPTINYCIAKVINSDECFRYENIDGKIVIWKVAHPLYTVVRKNSNNLFSHKYTEYNDDFSIFYKGFLADKALAEQCDRLYYDKDLPRNLVCTSIIPNLIIDSLSFCYPLTESGSYIPFITVGQYFSENKKMLLPVTGEFHHVVNDGYHVQKFFHQLESTCNNFAP